MSAGGRGEHWQVRVYRSAYLPHLSEALLKSLIQGSREKTPVFLVGTSRSLTAFTGAWPTHRKCNRQGALAGLWERLAPLLPECSLALGHLDKPRVPLLKSLEFTLL